MKKLLIIFSAVLFFGCAVNKNALSINSGKYDAAFLKASYLANEGHTDEALVILNFINKKVKDEYIVLKIADLYISQKDYSAALNVIENAIKTKELKNKDILYYQKAKLLVASKKYNEAIKTLKIAVKLNPEEDYLKLLATLYSEKKDFASAIEIYTELIDKNKKSEYYYQRGKLYFKLHLDKNAISDLEKAVNIDFHTASLIDLSDYYIKKGNYEKAIEYLEKVNDEFETINVMAKYKLGQLYVKEKKDEKAIKVYEDIVDNIKGADQRFFILKQIATLYFEQKNYKKAEEYFIKALKYNNDIQTLYFIGIIGESLKDYELAKKYYKKALELDNKYSAVLKRLSYLELREGNYSKSLEYINSIDEINRDVDYYRQKAVIYHEMKDYKNQEKVLIEGLNHYKNNEELMLDYAFSLEAQKKYDETIKLLNKMIEIYPDNASALNFLGYLYADLNRNLEDAYKLVSKALKINPNNYAYLDSMAWILYRQGKFKEAYEYQIKALKKNPEEKEVVEHMKAILKALGSRETIEDILKK